MIYDHPSGIYPSNSYSTQSLISTGVMLLGPETVLFPIGKVSPELGIGSLFSSSLLEDEEDLFDDEEDLSLLEEELVSGLIIPPPPLEEELFSSLEE